MKNALVLALVLAGCGSDPADTDAGPLDAGGETDAGDLDAGRDTDGGTSDAGSSADATVVDAALDGGAPLSDAGPCVIDRTVTSGRATYYEPGTSATACFSPSLGAPMTTAVSPAIFADAARCGACVRVTGPDAEIVVVIADLCPECPANELDLSAEAFDLIADPVAGRVDVQWQLVPCDDAGTIRYGFQGSHTFYLKLMLRDHRAPLAAVSLVIGGTDHPMTRTADNGWLATGAPTPFTPPLTFRVTNSFGESVMFDAPAITADGVLIDSGVQHAESCAP